MAIALYMDVHIPKPITAGLLLRGVDVLTSQEDNTDTWPDSDLVDRATRLNRVLFTFDTDFFAEARCRQSLGVVFSGIIYAQPLNVSIGKCISDLELICKAGLYEDFSSHITCLPL